MLATILQEMLVTWVNMVTLYRNGSNFRDSVPVWKEVCIFRPLVMPYKAMPTGMAGNQSNVETGATASRNTHCSCTALIISCLGIVYDFFGLFFQVGKNVVFLYITVS